MAMLKFALYDYIPKRRIRRASFEEIDLTRRILDFKDGRRYASRWAARAVNCALSATNLKETVIVCIPASCQRTHVRRYRRFSSELCRLSGAANGFEHVRVDGKRRKVHMGHNREEADTAGNIRIDDTFFQGKKVVVFDDICTTCRTANAFIDRMKAAGADVRMTIFLAKTKRMKSYY